MDEAEFWEQFGRHLEENKEEIAKNQEEFNRIWGDDFYSMTFEGLRFGASPDGLMLGLWFKVPGRSEPLKVSIPVEHWPDLVQSLMIAVKTAEERRKPGDPEWQAKVLSGVPTKGRA